MVEEPLMTERENILTRIREALSFDTPHAAHASASAKLPEPADHRRVLPLVSASADEQWATFVGNAADLRADVRLVNDMAELIAELKLLRDRNGWKRLATHAGGLTSAATQALDLPLIQTDSAYDKNELAICDAGITECDVLVAQTGSVVVTNRSAGGRALSILPPHHIVLARREQLLADLPAAYAWLKAKYRDHYPSMISVITGPSRTGDIERILVLGAHGPKQLTIFVFNR
jgi:L-lactate dehydrogenase complex protein LldG